MVMHIEPLPISDILLLEPERHRDERGFFSETYNKRALAERGIELDVVQDNHSLSVEKGTVRGLHFQCPPFAQAKLVRVVRGAILDVAVDIRTGSPTYGRHVHTALSADNWRQVYVPVGFAHGFCTLAPDTEVIYKVANYYSPDQDRGLLWCDPALAIDWPVAEADAVVSDKDRKHPSLADLPEFFVYEPLAND